MTAFTYCTILPYKESLKFEVVPNMTDVGVARIAHSWELEI